MLKWLLKIDNILVDTSTKFVGHGCFTMHVSSLELQEQYKKMLHEKDELLENKDLGARSIETTFSPSESKWSKHCLNMSKHILPGRICIVHISLPAVCGVSSFLALPSCIRMTSCFGSCVTEA